MDLSLGADAFGSAYLQRHHLQQQQQQLHYQQQQQEQQQHHYPYHHPQQALSLAPPSGRGFLDLESLEQKGAHHGGLGLGHLGPSFSYQQDFGLSSYPAGAPDPASAAGYRPLDFGPSHSSGQLWPLNSVSPQVGGPAQTLHNSSARASHDLHSAAYGGGGAQGLHGWAVNDPHRLQFGQHSGDNCLPPGVEPGADPAFSYGVNSQLHGRPQPYPQAPLHPSQDLQPYRPWQQRAPSGVTTGTGGRPPQKLYPRRRSMKSTEKRNTAGKTAITKGTGAVPNQSPETGPGWCSVCQRNCVTAVALRQHLEGKGHKKKVDRMKLPAEPATSKQSPEENGGVSNMLEQVWMQVSSRNKPSEIGNPRKKQKTEEAGQAVSVTPGAEGDFTIRKRKPKAGKDVQSTAVNTPNATDELQVRKTKEVVKVRCEHCNVECNSQSVLEIHLGGKKHAARMKKLQEAAGASKPEETTLVSQ